MKHFNEYIKEVRASGHYAFTTQDALSDLGITRNAFNCGMYKLRKKGDIVSPAKNLYIVAGAKLMCAKKLRHLNIESTVLH